MLEFCFVGFCIAGLIMCFVMFIKNNNTCKNHLIIVDAICKYNQDCIIRDKWDKRISYDDMRDYNETMWRLFDWGYENILPPEEFELIKPFIDEKSYKKY